jgi:hypothetical protein
MPKGVCLGRPQAKRCWASNARSQPGAIPTPLVRARYEQSRSEVHTSKPRPSWRGEVSSASASAWR